MSSKQRKYFNKKKHIVNEDESSSSEDDQNAELLTEELEKDFLKVLSHLKKKNPNLYNDNLKFFCNNENTTKKDLKAKENREGEITQWLKGQKSSVEVEEKEELEALHDFWSNPNLDEKEQYLRDYLLDKTFLKQDDTFDPSKEIEKLEEEEREVEEQLVFEEKFNYRFENCDEEFLKNYPRTMDKTNRSKSDTSQKEESSDEEKALEFNKQNKSNKECKTVKNFEPTSESDHAVKNSKSNETVVDKVLKSTVTNDKEKSKNPKRVLKNKRKINIFEITSSTTRPKQEDFRNNQESPKLKPVLKKHNEELFDVKAPSSKRNDWETKNRYKKEKLKILSSRIRHLKNLISHHSNKKTEFRINRKIINLLDKNMKEKSISNKNKTGLSSENKNINGGVHKKRKLKHQAKATTLHQMPENSLKKNVALQGRPINKSISTGNMKRKEKCKGKVKNKKLE